MVRQDTNDNRTVRNKQVEEEDSNINPYQKAILNEGPREESKIEQMINWSIL